MNEKDLEVQLKLNAIEKYGNITRIKKYGAEEIAYQEKIIKAELKALDIDMKELEEY